MSCSNPKLLCFLGSGTSIPAGMPRTDEITETVIPPGDFYRHSADMYTLNWQGQINEMLFDLQAKKRAAINAVVEAGRDLVRIGFSRLNVPIEDLNYEDVAFTLGQLYDAEGGGRDDPLAAFGRRFISRRVAKYIPEAEVDLLNLLSSTVSCITDLVAEMLDRKITTTEHLKFLGSAIAELGVDGIIVVTTNHDLVLESFLQGIDAPFDDGFSEPVNGARLWRPLNSFQRKGHLQFLKIHGSINWYDMMPPMDWHFKGEIAQRYDPNCNLGMYHHPDGDIWELRSNRPQILIGTFNKTDSYTEGIFSELFCRWRSNLSSCRNLFVSGYGFRDHGINRLLLNWAFSDRKRRLIVADPDPESSHRRMKAGMSNRLKELHANGVLVSIEQGIENVSWDQIREVMIG